MCVRNTNEKSSQCGLLGDDGLAKNKAAQILKKSSNLISEQKVTRRYKVESELGQRRYSF